MVRGTDDQESASDTDGPNNVDIHVGHQIRDRRAALGMSQQQLGQKVGLTFQQIQKYERASNRVSASRMYRLFRALDVDANYFFAGYSDGAAMGGFRTMVGFNEAQQGLAPPVKPYSLSHGRQKAELDRIFDKITDKADRKALLDYARRMLPKDED